MGSAASVRQAKEEPILLKFFDEFNLTINERPLTPPTSDSESEDEEEVEHEHEQEDVLTKFFNSLK